MHLLGVREVALLSCPTSSVSDGVDSEGGDFMEIIRRYSKYSEQQLIANASLKRASRFGVLSDTAKPANLAGSGLSRTWITPLRHVIRPNSAKYPRRVLH